MKVISLTEGRVVIKENETLYTIDLGRVPKGQSRQSKFLIEDAVYQSSHRSCGACTQVFGIQKDKDIELTIDFQAQMKGKIGKSATVITDKGTIKFNITGTII